jgi:hypothetical protein
MQFSIETEAAVVAISSTPTRAKRMKMKMRPTGTTIRKVHPMTVPTDVHPMGTRRKLLSGNSSNVQITASFKKEKIIQPQNLQQFHPQLSARTIVVQTAMIITTTTIIKGTALENQSNKITTQAITTTRFNCHPAIITLQQLKKVPLL